MKENIYVDRYTALGIPYPEKETMCEGQCEGIGFVPIHKDEPDLKWKKLWQKDHDESCGIIEKAGELLKKLPASFTRRSLLYWWKRLPYELKECDSWHFVKCLDCNGTGNK